MKRRAKRTVVLGCAAVAFAALAVVFWREPGYRGRSLTYWVDQLWRAGADQEQARSAIRSIGPKAVPCLLAKVRPAVGRWSNQGVWDMLPEFVQELFPRPRPLDHLTQKIPYAISLIGAPAIPQLLAALQDPDREVRLTAAQSMTCLGERANSALPGLMPLLNHRNPEIRVQAILALSQMGTIRTQAIPALIIILSDGPGGADRDASVVQASACRALGGMGPRARVALPQLGALLDDSNPSTRLEAASALWQIEHDTNLVDRVIAQLEKRQGIHTYRGFIDLLAQMGPAARPAVPEILRTMTNWGPDVSGVVRRALVRIDPSGE